MLERTHIETRPCIFTSRGSCTFSTKDSIVVVRDIKIYWSQSVDTPMLIVLTFVRDSFARRIPILPTVSFECSLLSQARLNPTLDFSLNSDKT